MSQTDLPDVTYPDFSPAQLSFLQQTVSPATEPKGPKTVLPATAPKGPTKTIVATQQTNGLMTAVIRSGAGNTPTLAEGNNSLASIDFTSGGRALIQADIEQAVSDLGGIDPLVIWAIIRKESLILAGFLAGRKPVILYERHKFAGATNSRFSAGYPDISGPRYLNDGTALNSYGTLSNQYKRLTEAMLLDQAAALQACSWGIGQVMGGNFLSLGYATVQAMVAAMIVSEGNQLRAIVEFLQNSNLVEPLQNKDWDLFANGYNGGADPTYAGILAADYSFYETNGPPDLTIRSAQLYLNYLGYQLNVDGRLGDNTTAAIQKFQTISNIIPPRGTLDSSTVSALERAVFGS